MSEQTTVIYHRADFDGIFCREIARKFLPDADLIGWDYGDPLVMMPTFGVLYILDLSPDCLVPSGFDWGRITWIDHHKSSIEKYRTENGYPLIAGYRIDGVSACRLAWQWFTGRQGWLADKEQFVNRTVLEPMAVRLAGEYDIWDKRDPRVDTFQFGLRSQEITANDWAILLGTGSSGSWERSDLIDTLLANGALLQRYQQEQDASVVKRGFEVEFEGLKFLALNTARCNSLTFEAAAQPNHDGLMGFYWNGHDWRVSLYHSPHHKEHDLSQIAVKYGGGGHRGACGFQVSSLPFVACLPWSWSIGTRFR